MVYPAWLFAFSLFSLAAERLWPRIRQALLRRGIVNDLTYLIVNGEYLGVLLDLTEMVRRQISGDNLLGEMNSRRSRLATTFDIDFVGTSPDTFFEGQRLLGPFLCGGGCCH